MEREFSLSSEKKIKVLVVDDERKEWRVIAVKH